MRIRGRYGAGVKLRSRGTAIYYGCSYIQNLYEARLGLGVRLDAAFSVTGTASELGAILGMGLAWGSSRETGMALGKGSVCKDLPIYRVGVRVQVRVRSGHEARVWSGLD